MAGQRYIYSQYFKSGHALRLPEPGKHLQNTNLFADTNATKEQILAALKITE